MGLTWFEAGFQLGLLPGITVGFIPVFLAYHWSNLWIILLFPITPLGVVGIVVFGNKTRHLLQKRELYLFLVGFISGTVAAATAILTEFFFIHGAGIVAIFLWIGYKITRWTYGIIRWTKRSFHRKQPRDEVPHQQSDRLGIPRFFVSFNWSWFSLELILF